jgi:hypothetical protein
MMFAFSQGSLRESKRRIVDAATREPHNERFACTVQII